jgi:hypothetical protein
VERVRVTVRLQVVEARVKPRAPAVEFELDSREVRCLFTDVFQRSVSCPARMFVERIATT